MFDQSICYILLFVIFFCFSYSDSLDFSKNSYRIGPDQIFFKNTEKETTNQTFELISNKNKKLKFWNKN
jgi:hypothetical protein